MNRRSGQQRVEHILARPRNGPYIFVCSDGSYVTPHYLDDKGWVVVTDLTVAQCYLTHEEKELPKTWGYA